MAKDYSAEAARRAARTEARQAARAAHAPKRAAAQKQRGWQTPQEQARTRRGR
jgi:hypothetical protein